MRHRIHRGLWLAKVVALSASLIGILLLIDQLQTRKIRFEARTPAEAVIDKAEAAQ